MRMLFCTFAKRRRTVFRCCPPAAHCRVCWFAIDKRRAVCYYTTEQNDKESIHMKRIRTLDTRDLKKSVENGGCGECQTSCQSACKTSCGVANQQCEKCMEQK